MKIRAECPGCGKVVKGGNDWAGRTGKCPGCGAVIKFAEPDPFVGLEEFAVEEFAVVEKAIPSPPEFRGGAPSPSQPSSWPIRFEYNMVQIPPSIVVHESKGNEAAEYLQRVVDQYSQHGWEFYRLDPIGVHVTPGCLGFLMGIRNERREFYVITFRRPVEGV